MFEPEGDDIMMLGNVNNYPCSVTASHSKRCGSK